MMVPVNYLYFLDTMVRWPLWLKVKDNTVELFVFSAEKPEEIDAFRAQEAKERAQEQLQQKQSIMEYHVSRASLARAMARLRGYDKYNTK